MTINRLFQAALHFVVWLGILAFCAGAWVVAVIAFRELVR